MLKYGELFMIHDLHRQGLKISAIAKRTGLDRKTVSKYLRWGIEPPVYGPRKPRESILAPYQEYLKARVEAYPQLSAKRLLREIRSLGYRGGYSIVTDYLRDVRPAKPSGYEHRFETAPGEQAQVDFAHFKVVFSDEPEQVRVVWLFSMVLGFSRYLYAHFVLRQDLQTLVRCHLQALAAFGGVPKTILYDRMKSAVIDEQPAGQVIFNATLLDLARHYGFTPRACAPYRAKTKGKVERPFRYIRQDFFLARQFRNLQDLNQQLGQWLDEVANQRCHGTTRRLISEAKADEQSHLQALPMGAFRNVLKLQRRISRDGMVSVEGNEYSVPDTTRRRPVEVHVLADELRIYEGGRLIASHPPLQGRGRRRIAAGHRRFPAPGNAKVRRHDLDARPLGVPGEQVERRTLAVYEAVAGALAAAGQGDAP